MDKMLTMRWVRCKDNIPKAGEIYFIRYPATDNPDYWHKRVLFFDDATITSKYLIGIDAYYLDESPSDTLKADAVAFAEWINKQPYLFGKDEYGWYYDIPSEGTGVDHKLVGTTANLYDLYTQSLNK